jgi:hypothetical protein
MLLDVGTLAVTEGRAVVDSFRSSWQPKRSKGVTGNERANVASAVESDGPCPPGAQTDRLDLRQEHA